VSLQNLKQSEMSKTFELKHFLFTQDEQLGHSPRGNFASPPFAAPRFDRFKGPTTRLFATIAEIAGGRAERLIC